jgi:hypothetical protein
MLYRIVCQQLLKVTMNSIYEEALETFVPYKIKKIVVLNNIH